MDTVFGVWGYCNSNHNLFRAQIRLLSIHENYFFRIFHNFLFFLLLPYVYKAKHITFNYTPLNYSYSARVEGRGQIHAVRDSQRRGRPEKDAQGTG